MFCALAPLVLVLATSDASVSGSVHDVSGLFLPGAQITLIDANGRQHATTSGADGTFAFPSVAPGDGRLRVTVPGFEPYGQKLRIGVETSLPLRIVMALPRLSQEVTVSASATGVPATALHSSV